MSIEKIKQRIKMIEDNDFSTINEIDEKPGQYTKQDFDAIAKSGDAGSTFARLGSAGAYAKSAEKNIKSAFSGSSDRVVVGDLFQLPNDYESYIFPIYKLLEKHRVLTNDLDQTTFNAISGYKPESSRNFKIKNKLVLQSGREIEFLFHGEISNTSDLKNNKILEMSINLESFRANNTTGIINFTTELNANRNLYHIHTITPTTKTSAKYLIKFN